MPDALQIPGCIRCPYRAFRSLLMHDSAMTYKTLFVQVKLIIKGWGTFPQLLL